MYFAMYSTVGFRPKRYCFQTKTKAKSTVALGSPWKGYLAGAVARTERAILANVLLNFNDVHSSDDAYDEFVVETDNDCIYVVYETICAGPIYGQLNAFSPVCRSTFYQYFYYSPCTYTVKALLYYFSTRFVKSSDFFFRSLQRNLHS